MKEREMLVSLKEVWSFPFFVSLHSQGDFIIIIWFCFLTNIYLLDEFSFVVSFLLSGL